MRSLRVGARRDRCQLSVKSRARPWGFKNAQLTEHDRRCDVAVRWSHVATFQVEDVPALLPMIPTASEGSSGAMRSGVCARAALGSVRGDRARPPAAASRHSLSTGPHANVRALRPWRRSRNHDILSNGHGMSLPKGRPRDVRGPSRSPVASRATRVTALA